MKAGEEQADLADEANRAAFRQDDIDAKRQLGELRSATAGWSEDLEVLRRLL